MSTITRKIYGVYALASDDANRTARVLSIAYPGDTILAVVTADTSGLYIGWATTEQALAANETRAGVWRDGQRIE